MSNNNYSVDQLIGIAIALSAEKDTSKVLDMILQVAMQISHCDAGTVYVVEEDHLNFHNSYTYAKGFDEDSSAKKNTMPPVPLSRDYISACAVLDRKKINIKDVYTNTEYNFSGAMKYDKISGYRTKSMLVIPMEDDRGDIIGVLQLINAQNEDGEVVEFPSDHEDIIAALASLGAVILTNRKLSEQILETLHSFVKVMVEAIETRSAYNANHTKNMVKYAGKFLDYIGEIHDERILTEEERDSYLMSVWLHDIGKLVIPLEIMDKPTRLGDLEKDIRNRVKIACLQEEILGLKGEKPTEEAQGQIQRITDAWNLIEESNGKGFLPDEVLDNLKAAATIQVRDDEGKEISLLTEKELEAITIRKGTLTDEERNTMQSHVVYTAKMLKKMTFKGLYANIPGWSGGHHEFLDGSGYPNHLTAKDIPKEVRLLTIIDVYDALTAEDRPYKPPMPPEKAFGILDSMVQEGKLDGEILQMFKDSKAWVKTEKKENKEVVT
ncbi:HD domain-containing phosphohydrolase [Butyrivibrio sp. AE2032]|uniref:HD domain-containing phosphohydrolase n=1 Tax=Butyrivibrio sp. AE2032 TaxID=1458463 RepID=UPI00054E3368|nr:HD domain-containing phosphohydrolase [Butyrivibrio sp. AE2032]